MKKISLILSILFLTACTTENINNSTNNTSNSSIINSSLTNQESNTLQETLKNQTYSHEFLKTDFDSNGGVTANINGIKWTYSAFNYLGYEATKGIQIGSKNNPQTTSWVISASFDEEITITSYEIVLSTASDGKASYTITFGNYENTANFSNTSPTSYSITNLEEPTNSFSLSLTAQQRAIYLKEISFTAKVKENSSIKLITDSGENSIPNVSVTPGVNDIPATNYSLISKEKYYETINLNSDSVTLLSSLRTLISTMTKVSYGDARTMLQYTDESPEKTGYLYGLYDGDEIKAIWDQGSSWNREHVWPRSKMALNGVVEPANNSVVSHASDLHNLRVSCQTTNGSHGDNYFDEENTNGFYPNSSTHDSEGDFRGDVARILFYMYVRYEGLKLVDKPNDNLSMGNLSTLLSWNKNDPVDAFEIQRNNRIYEYQGNRNPFIDYPELADKFFK